MISRINALFLCGLFLFTPLCFADSATWQLFDGPSYVDYLNGPKNQLFAVNDLEVDQLSPQQTQSTNIGFSLGIKREIPIQNPDGVNFGGVFLLEDWFFSPQNLGTQVATPCVLAAAGGVANSRIFLQDNHAPNFQWNTETDLIQKLESNGYTDAMIIAAFDKHRRNYFLQEAHGPQSLEDSFLLLRNLGIQTIRLPLTWALIYPNQSYTITGSSSTVTIPASNNAQLINDPFFSGLKWAGIPIAEVQNVLRVAAKYNMKVMLDIHAYPGGSGDGTYNGIWPNAPRFWTVTPAQYHNNFTIIMQNLMQWSTSLYQTDPTAARALWGINPMNEPAHLFGDLAARCNSTTPWGLNNYQDVLDTLQIAVSSFRNSDLPKRGAKLDMNIIETMFPSTMPQATKYQIIGNWWKSITSPQERSSWAVLDIHHYVAWDPNCNQCLANYVTQNVITPAGFENILTCNNWYLELRSLLGLLPKAEQLSVTEFSASTDENTQTSCSSGVGNMVPYNHATYRNIFFKDQLNKARNQNLNMYFWTWMLPFNANFQAEWSMYTLYNQQRGSAVD